MLLDIEPKYGGCNEIYLGDREGSTGSSRCCVTTYFLFTCLNVFSVYLLFKSKLEDSSFFEGLNSSLALSGNELWPNVYLPNWATQRAKIDLGL